MPLPGLLFFPRTRSESDSYAARIPLLEYLILNHCPVRIAVLIPVYSSQGCYFRLRGDGHPSDTVALEPFTRALRKFVTSPAYTGLVDASPL
jgi:hypothetical protein